MSASKWSGCPSCPICDGPAVGHAPRTRSTYLRCAGCGHAWYPSFEQKKAAERFTARIESLNEHRVAMAEARAPGEAGA